MAYDEYTGDFVDEFDEWEIKYENLIFHLFTRAQEEYDEYWTNHSDTDANAHWNRYRGIASVIEESGLREKFQLWQETVTAD